jgi:oligopeptide transport system substrate-binding protein
VRKETGLRPHLSIDAVGWPRWFVLGLLLVVAAFAVGASHMSAASAHPFKARAGGGALRIAITGAPDPFDPALLGDNRSIELAQNVYEGVLGVNNAARIVPALASTWTRSANGLVYTFNLRHGLHFGNGDPITAEDLVYTYNRSLNPKTASGTSFFLEDIKGADAVLSGKAKAASGIKAAGKYTLKVTLAHKAGYFAAEISRWPAWVVDSKVIARYGKGWITPPHNIGSGAYELTGQVGDQQYTFTANPSYYLGKPKIARVSVSAVPDSTAAVARYQAGEFDAVVGLSAAAILQAKANSTLRSQFHTTPIERTVWLEMNNSKPPFNKLAVRQAFNHAIDKNAIIKIALAGVGTPANAWLPPGIAGNVNAQHSGSTYNVGLARQLLAKAGYPDGKGFPSVELDYGINYGEYAQVYELIQGQLEKNLGIKIGLKELPINAFNNELTSAKTRPLLWGYTFGFDYPDAQELDQYLGIRGAPYNYDGYSNKTYDRLVAQANAESNQATRAKLYARAENVRLADAPTVPLYFVNQNWLVKPNVKGFGYSPLYMHPWRQVSIQP